MIARILPLSMHVANQIAAGEVIESPASVVKELLENALDAKSTSITVDIGFGGLNHIIVSDNGVGIYPEDLPLVVAPHATSKLRVLDDLYTLNTMGFRGEALASMTSVSHVMLTSKCKEAAYAACLKIDALQVTVVPAAREQGTTVEVRDLFYNATVRKTFLKSQALEYMAVEAVVKRFALAEPTIALKLIHNEQVKLHLPAATCDTTRHLRLKKLFGKTFFENAILVQSVSNDLTLTGWVSHPKWVRSQSDRQWIYMNKRMVKDRVLMHAIKMAYETKIHHGKHPLYVLYFTIPPHEVDINVHPTKHEVRFTAPRLVHDFVYSAIHDVLSQTEADLSVPAIQVDTRGLKAMPSDVVESWFTLNKYYAILAFEQIYFLVNVGRLRDKAHAELFSSRPFPWVSRPLLVPVLIPLQHAAALLEAFQTRLHDFGFDIILEFNERLRINAIPAAIPLIDVHYFFQRLSSIAVQHEALLTHLLASDAWSLEIMTAEERSHWWHYWYFGMQEHRTMPHTILLNEDACEVLCRA